MTTQTIPGVSEAVRLRARDEAQAIMRDLTGVRAVVIATSDGFELAADAHGVVDVRRIAALASSIAAIGAVVSSEAGLGNTTNVTVGTDNGFAVVHSTTHAGIPLVIQIIAGADALLAQVNYRATAAARALAAA